MNRAALALLLALTACTTATPPPPAPVALPPPAPPPGLTRILGASVATVTALLGKAALDRSEGTARQLVFIRPVCILDVYLYPAAGGALAVRTAAARKPDGSRMDPAACLALIAPVR